MTPTISGRDQADTLLEFTLNSLSKLVPNLVLVKDSKADSVHNDAYDDVQTVFFLMVPFCISVQNSADKIYYDFSINVSLASSLACVINANISVSPYALVSC